jgi:hypothetical protein
MHVLLARLGVLDLVFVFLDVKVCQCACDAGSN